MLRISFIFLITLLVSCSTKYSGLHSDVKIFNKDIDYCLKEACEKPNESFLNNFSIIPSAFAYGGGGGGGGGGGMGASFKNKIFYKTFNICLTEKGYTKDKDGVFELPFLTCD